MTKKKEKQQDENKVNKVVADNFFKYLSKKGISQGQYAKEHFLNPATVSNWKSGNGVMSAEQIKEAAEYFEITVNDLYYDDNEKKKIEVLSDKNYHPIMAQQTIETRLLNYEFNKPFESVVTIFATFILTIIFSFFLVKQSVYWSLIVLAGFISVYLYYSNNFGEKKTFVINYLDDIYYYNENAKKISRKRNIVFHLILLLLHFVLFLGLGWSYSVATIEIDLIFIIALMVMASFVVNFFTFLGMLVKYKTQMYDTEFEHHKLSVVTMSCSIALFGFVISLVSFSFINHIFSFIVSIIMVLCSILNYYFVCSNYSKYNLVYEDETGKIERLFKKNI